MLRTARVMSSYYPAKRIGPYNLWIGSKADSENVAAARRNGVSLIVNCTRDLPFVVPRVSRLRVPVDDDPADAATMLAYLPRAVTTIDAHLDRGDAVLVHCFAGISRSASVVAAYLMHREGLTPKQAMARIRRSKPETFSSPNFLGALNAFHSILRKKMR